MKQGDFSSPLVLNCALECAGKNIQENLERLKE
jgi:predicted small metal-binding protein